MQGPEKLEALEVLLLLGVSQCKVTRRLKDVQKRMGGKSSGTERGDVTINMKPQFLILSGINWWMQEEGPEKKSGRAEGLGDGSSLCTRKPPQQSYVRETGEHSKSSSPSVTVAL